MRKLLPVILLALAMITLDVQAQSKSWYYRTADLLDQKVNKRVKKFEAGLVPILGIKVKQYDEERDKKNGVTARAYKNDKGQLLVHTNSYRNKVFHIMCELYIDNSDDGHEFMMSYLKGLGFKYQGKEGDFYVYKKRKYRLYYTLVKENKVNHFGMMIYNNKKMKKFKGLVDL